MSFFTRLLYQEKKNFIAVQYITRRKKKENELPYETTIVHHCSVWASRERLFSFIYYTFILCSVCIRRGALCAKGTGRVVYGQLLRAGERSIKPTRRRPTPRGVRECYIHAKGGIFSFCEFDFIFWVITSDTCGNWLLRLLSVFHCFVGSDANFRNYAFVIGDLDFIGWDSQVFY